MMQILQFILALSLLIFLHEFGHYIFARIFGIKVEKFYLFFNPRFSIMRYIPAEGRLEFCTWMDKEEQPHSLVCFNVGQDYEKNGKKIPAWKQTIYGIGWIPLGGYCAIAGMIDETQDKEKLAAEPQPWEFRTKPAWQRLLVMTGGVIFNFLTAIVIYIGMSFHWGEAYYRFHDAYAGLEFYPSAIEAGFRNGDIPLMADGKEIEADIPNVELVLAQARTVSVLRNGRDTVTIHLPSDFLLQVDKDKGFYAYRYPVVVAEAMKGEPADKAGLITGDRIIAVGDSLTPSFSELTVALAAYAGKPTKITVVRNEKEISLTAMPNSAGLLGLKLTPLEEIYPVQRVRYGLIESIPAGWNLGTSTLTNYVKSMRHIFSKEGAKSIGGFGSMIKMFPERWNWYKFWGLTAFLSLALAFMNILPIPALDGGHVLFLLCEVVTRRKPSDRFLEVVQSIGFFLLVALLLYANFNDVIRFSK